MGEADANGDIGATEIEEAESVPFSTSNPIPVAGLSLKLNFSWTFAGNVIYSGCQWGMLVVLAKLGTPEVVGKFALGFAVTAPVVMFANLKLNSILATDAKFDYKFGEYLALRFLTAIFALLVITGIVLISGFRRETALVLFAIGLAKIFESVSDIYYGLLQQYERMDRIAKSMIIRGILSLLVLGTIYFTTLSIVFASFGLAVTWAVVMIFYDTRSSGVIAKTLAQSGDSSRDAAERADMLRPRWHIKRLYKLAGLALPLGFVMMLISLYCNIPRYFIERYMGERDLGIYAAMAYLMVAGSTVISALGQSSVPRLAKYYGAGDRSAYRNLLVKLVGIGASVGAAGILIVAFAGKWLLTTFYGPEYTEYAAAFVWIAVASSIAYIQWFLDGGMTVARRFRIQVPLFCLNTGITALSCFLLIPKFGVMGAAFSLIVGSLVLALGALGVNIHILSKFGRKPDETAQS